MDEEGDVGCRYRLSIIGLGWVGHGVVRCVVVLWTRRVHGKGMVEKEKPWKME